MNWFLTIRFTWLWLKHLCIEFLFRDPPGKSGDERYLVDINELFENAKIIEMEGSQPSDFTGNNPIDYSDVFSDGLTEVERDIADFHVTQQTIMRAIKKSQEKLSANESQFSNQQKTEIKYGFAVTTEHNGYAADIQQASIVLAQERKVEEAELGMEMAWDRLEITRRSLINARQEINETVDKHHLN